MLRADGWLGRGRGVLLLALLTGCYHYVPLGGGQAHPSPATRLRVILARPQPVRLGNITVNEAARIEGEYVDSERDTLLLSALSVVDSAGAEHLGGGATVRVAYAAIEDLQARRFSAWRSLLATGGFVVAGLLSGVAVSEGGGSGGRAGPPGQSK